MGTTGWIYIVDLDAQKFKIPLRENKTIDFPIANIPFDWKKRLNDEL